MYQLFRYKNIMPHEYVTFKKSERIILKAFLRKLRNDMEEEFRQIGGG